MGQGRGFSTVLAFFTSLVMVLYWVLVFTGATPVKELIPGYVSWALSYPPADAWIAICAFLTGYFLLKRNEKATLYGLLCGSSLIFLGIAATTYTLITGMLSMFTWSEMAVKMGMRAFHFAAGTYFIVDSWKSRGGYDLSRR